MKKLIHKHKWTAGDTPNIPIGQGYNLLTPIQMANLYSSLSNGGKTWKPQLVEDATILVKLYSKAHQKSLIMKN